MKKVNLHLLLAVCCLGLGIKSSSAQNSKGYWQLIQGDPFPDSVTQIVAGPGSLVYMATSDKGIFKSTDEGENWKQINTGLNGDLDITLLALGPKGDLLARDSYGNILYSKDAASWVSESVPWYWQYPGASAKAFAFDSNGAVYVGTVGAGIYKRDSIGDWNQVMAPDIIPGVQAMVFDNQNRLIVHYDKLYRLKSDFSVIDTSWGITYTGNNAAQLLKSTWGSVIVVADTMYELTEQLRKLTSSWDENFVVDSSGNIYSFSFPWIIWDGLVKSSDHGATWQITPYGDAYLPSERFVEATSEGFISDGEGEPEVRISSDSNIAFIPIHELDDNLDVSIQVDRLGNLVAFELSGQEPDGGIWSSSDHGITWRRRMSPQNIAESLQEDGKYYAYTSDTTVIVSDDGVNFRPLNLPSVKRVGLYASPNGTLWAYYGYAHFMRSFDGGTTWSEFAHFTDVPPAYYDSDSAYASGVIERGNYIWLGTTYLHVTSDDGATWEVDTPHYAYMGITGGKDNTIIVHSSNMGIHWLSPGEDPDSGWLDVNGTYAEDLNGTMLQIEWPYQTYSTPQALIRETKSGNILDTLCMIPDSLVFSLDPGNISPPTMAIDSLGNIFAVASGGSNSKDHPTKAGLYRFISATASVAQPPPPSDNLDMSVTNNILTISCSEEIQFAEIIDVMGRSMIELPDTHSTTVTASVASIPNGFYFVKTETTEGTVVRKVMIVR